MTRVAKNTKKTIQFEDATTHIGFRRDEDNLVRIVTDGVLFSDVGPPLNVAQARKLVEWLEDSIWEMTGLRGMQ